VRPPRATLRVRNNRSTGTPRSEYFAIAPSESYCQIYCQKRGGEGIPGDGELRVFSNLLNSICVYVGSNPTLSAMQCIRQAGIRRSGRISGENTCQSCMGALPAGAVERALGANSAVFLYSN
jgi:hypothetical protein